VYQLLTFATHDDALRRVKEREALEEVAGALRWAYVKTAGEPRGRLRPSSVVT
jgi:hypothetical protein